jgi:hypothetical protein
MGTFQSNTDTLQSKHGQSLINHGRSRSTAPHLVESGACPLCQQCSVAPPELPGGVGLVHTTQRAPRLRISPGRRSAGSSRAAHERGRSCNRQVPCSHPVHTLSTSPFNRQARARRTPTCLRGPPPSRPSSSSSGSRAGGGPSRANRCRIETRRAPVLDAALFRTPRPHPSARRVPLAAASRKGGGAAPCRTLGPSRVARCRNAPRWGKVGVQLLAGSPFPQPLGHTARPHPIGRLPSVAPRLPPFAALLGRPP